MTTASHQRSEQTTDNTTIRPFRVNVPEIELTELRRRISATKFPERETVMDATRGVQLETVQTLAQYWATEYDWRKIEAKLNALPQFTDRDARVVRLDHQQMKIIDPLTNPTAHGGKASDAFDVVIPSMPGYGISGKPQYRAKPPGPIVAVEFHLLL